MKERTLIGFSLSFCVKDILEGKVDIDNVLFIQTACSPRSEDDVKDILAAYGQWYWKDNFEKALAIVGRLRNDHRLGWANTWQKNTPNIAWGVWLSTKNNLAVPNGCGQTSDSAEFEVAISRDK